MGGWSGAGAASVAAPDSPPSSGIFSGQDIWDVPRRCRSGRRRRPVGVPGAVPLAGGILRWPLTWDQPIEWPIIYTDSLVS